MSTNKQRRESERQRLQRQLEERRERELARRRNAIIASVVGALVVIAAVVVAVVVSTGGSEKKKPTATKPSPSTSPSSTPAAPVEPVAPKLATACARPGGSTASYAGVTVTGATDLRHEPKVAARVTKAPVDDLCQDLVVGKGAPATAASTVTVQYVGALADDGMVFDASWTDGQPATLAATGFVPGFSKALTGGGKVTPMRVGGRRMVIIPAASAYPAGGAGQATLTGKTLVFVIDLTKVSSQ